MNSDFLNDLIGLPLADAVGRIANVDGAIAVEHECLTNDLQSEADTMLVVRARASEGKINLVLTPFIMKV